MISIDIHSEPYQGFELKAKLQFAKGQIAVLTGDSGAGKTSLLNAIAGLEKANGTISIEDKLWLSDQEKVNLRPQDRNLAYVFQESTLFPNMTVKQNLEFALNKKPAQDLLSRYLGEVNLKEFQNRKPSQLSGGQKQRIDLIRSLITEPKLLLLDEPANAQDKNNRKAIQELLLKEKKRGMSMLIVSHDQDEIELLADVVFIMKEGEITEHYQPKKRRSKSFEIKGKVKRIENEKAIIETIFGQLEIENQNFIIGNEIKLKQKDIKSI
jgi:molybdate transport system ATP-binding protein